MDQIGQRYSLPFA